jgi:hypothetical protein
MGSLIAEVLNTVPDTFESVKGLCQPFLLTFEWLQIIGLPKKCKKCRGSLRDPT